MLHAGRVVKEHPKVDAIREEGPGTDLLGEDADAQMYEAIWNELFNLQADWADDNRAPTTGASARTGTSRP